MPPAIPLVAAAAGYAATAAVGAGFLGSLAGFVVATAVNAVGSRALSKTPKGTPGNFTDSAQSRAEALTSSVESHKVIYGQARVSGPYAYIGTTTNGMLADGTTVAGTNRFLHLAIALAGHEVQEIGDVYFGDTLIATDANGWVTTAPYSQSQTSTSSVTLQANSVVRSSGVVTVSFPAPHALTAGTQFRIRYTNDATLDGVYNVASATPTTFTYIKAGKNTSVSAAQVVATVTTGTTLSFARVKKYFGSEAQAASAEMVAEIPGWTANHRLAGIAYLYVRLEYSRDAFPQGIPNISALVKGKKLYDPRTGLTAWGDNAALCIRDYLASDYGFDCDADEIDDGYAVAAANVCDESVLMTTGGTQRRYTCNGVIDTGVAPLENLNALVAATAGAVSYVQGAFRVHAGAYDAPAGDVTIDMLASEASIRPRTSRQQLFNAVRGTYVDPDLNWQPTDFPAVTNPIYEAQDGGQQIFKDIELAFANDSEKAQRIARIILEQGRQGIQAELKLNHRALPYAVWDTVTYTDAALGWDRKVFRIKKLSHAGTGPITLSLQEEAAACYDWDVGRATVVDPAPDTTLPDPFTAQPPKALTVAESTYVTRDGAGVKAGATLTWLASQDAFLDQYQAEYRLSGGAWTILPRTEDTTALILDIAPGTYDFRVKALNTLGVSSAYSTTSRHISGLLAPPTEPRNMTIASVGGLALIRWDASPDLDVQIGGRYVFRHSPQLGGPGWNEGVSVGPSLPGSATHAVFPLKPGTYMARAEDSSGIQSTAYTSIETSQATVLAYSPLATLVENPTFPGAKFLSVVVSGSLQIDGSGTVDDAASFDAIPNFDVSGGVSPVGFYNFSAAMDLGSVKRVRLTSHIKALIVNQEDLIDSRGDDIDDWPTFDGDTDALADAALYAQATDDDPSGTPTWGTAVKLESAEFEARAFQFFLILTSQSPTYNILIDELSVNAEELA